jgi:hypothetical protein
VYNIVDTMMSLPKSAQAELSAKVKRLEEDRKMPLISPTIKLALEEGELKGQQKVIIRQLHRRIGEIKPLLIDQIRKLPVEQMEELAEALLDFSTLANLEQWLQNIHNSLEQY